jgi:hypothetical protein
MEKKRNRGYVREKERKKKDARKLKSKRIRYMQNRVKKKAKCYDRNKYSNNQGEGENITFGGDRRGNMVLRPVHRPLHLEIVNESVQVHQASALNHN